MIDILAVLAFLSVVVLAALFVVAFMLGPGD